MNATYGESPGQRVPILKPEQARPQLPESESRLSQSDGTSLTRHGDPPLRMPDTSLDPRVISTI